MATTSESAPTEATDKAIKARGEVMSCARGDLYRVDVRLGAFRREVIARRSGRLVRHHIRILPGDIVDVELSPYDLSHGRLVYRHTS